MLRGTRNENGQIIIQNKQDILSLLSEQQQQQQQDKATAITLNQLPTTTTVARKTIVQGAATSSGTGSSISIVSSGGKETNTILLQTPINASQLESVLKAQNTAATATVATITAATATVATTTKSNAKLIERPFMLKHVRQIKLNFPIFLTNFHHFHSSRPRVASARRATATANRPLCCKR